MSKAVLISIRPKWCELIASGQKTVEVRKTAPKLTAPFKCYIYCTKSPDHPRGWLGCYDHDMHKFGLISPMNIEAGKHMNIEVVSGLVIGEFICERIIDWSYIPDPDESADPGSMAYDILTKEGERTCLEYDDIEAYGKGAPLYGWCISDLVIYEKPKELSEFRSWNTGVVFKDGYPMPTHEIKRPPQSWMYVEELI